VKCFDLLGNKVSRCPDLLKCYEARIKGRILFVFQSNWRLPCGFPSILPNIFLFHSVEPVPVALTLVKMRRLAFALAQPLFIATLY
jgi:hypothetical protein